MLYLHALNAKNVEMIVFIFIHVSFSPVIDELKNGCYKITITSPRSICNKYLKFLL